jgi:hypothetical protein
MKNSLTTEQLGLFGGVYGNDLAGRVASSDPASFVARVPSTWLELVAHPDAASIRAAWEPAGAPLPRFVEYLARAIAGAAIFEAHGVPVLAMALPDWNEEDCELGPGFCWMGTPTASEHIERLIDEVGPIPLPLEQLWRVANFIDTKEHSTLCSLDPTTRGKTEAPVVLPPLAGVDEPEGAYECLQIAVVNHQMVTCMTRLPGERAWSDRLMRRFRRTDQISGLVRKRLDDLLTDWTFSEWSP